MKRQFMDCAYDDPEPGDVIEHLTDQGWPQEIAEQYEDSHRPLYEIEVELEYDDEEDEVRVLGATIHNTKLVPLNRGD